MNPEINSESPSNYPNNLDTLENLFDVHDELRVTLAEDYHPGDKIITIYDEFMKMSVFPTRGLITLTEQQSEIDKRAITFSYDNSMAIPDATGVISTFENLTCLPYCDDTIKSKDITHVTMNVMAEHHNNIKNALIAIETFIGVKGTVDTKAHGPTLLGRTNFLTKLVLTPRVWFNADRVLGIAPLNVTFTNQSFRLGDGDIIYTWDFGDGNTSTQNVSIISGVTWQNGISMSTPSITHNYDVPNLYTVTLTVQNKYGQDSASFMSMINARIGAPNEAQYEIAELSTQIKKTDTTGFISIRSVIGQPINIGIKVGSTQDSGVDYTTNVCRPQNPPDEYSYAGEKLILSSIIYGSDSSAEPINFGTPIDPITYYTWSMDDDLTHPNSPNTKALYSVGGLYNVMLRTDTKLGAYRITSNRATIDSVETTNLWLWNYPISAINTLEPWDLAILGPGTSDSVSSYEFGLLCETFKISGISQVIDRDDVFLVNQYSDIATQTHARKEFRRNTGFAQRGTTNSGNQGTCLLYWASGKVFCGSDTTTDQYINVKSYNGFKDVYDTPNNIVPCAFARPWNWICLSNFSQSHFLFGAGETQPNTNPSYQVEQTYDFSSIASPITERTWVSGDYKNGASELQQHPPTPLVGIAENGYFAVYRSAWKDSHGYFVRNSGVGSYFRLSSFYKTNGTNPIISIDKLSDMPGIKTEGQLVSLVSGLFFFNNTGNIAAFNDITGVWEVGGPSQSSVSFMSLQDTNVSNFSLAENTLLATSDGNYAAYLSYDYSPTSFIKFNAQDATFTTLGSRPEGEQFMMSIY